MFHIHWLHLTSIESKMLLSHLHSNIFWRTCLLLSRVPREPKKKKPKSIRWLGKMACIELPSFFQVHFMLFSSKPKQKKNASIHSLLASVNNWNIFMRKYFVFSSFHFHSHLVLFHSKTISHLFCFLIIKCHWECKKVEQKTIKENENISSSQHRAETINATVKDGNWWQATKDSSLFFWFDDSNCHILRSLKMN